MPTPEPVTAATATRRFAPNTAIWWRTSPGALLVLGVLVGLAAGVGAVVFRALVVGATEVFSGHHDYSAAGRVPNGHVAVLGIWFLVLAPVVGGLIYGPLIERFAGEAKGHGVPEVMLAVSENGGRIRPRVAAVKSLASALCIGCGGSVGREGPIVQIGSALGSSFGQTLGLSERRLRLLVACGAAGGISATFNAPIAGVFFALELILRDFEVESFGVVVLSSVAASVVGRAAFGSAPFLTIAPFSQRSVWEYGFYVALGLAAAVVGTGFVRVLYGMEDAADRIWRGPAWLRPAIGGVLLGALLLAVPQLYGVGYPVLQRAVGGNYALWFLLALLAGKIVATSLTMAIGGSGGVFAPSLFMGAMLGAACGDAAAQLAPHTVGPEGAYALVGMGAVFAAASRAPITAVIIIFELTGDYHIILPLMVAVVIAVSVAALLSGESIYTTKLRRRGITLRRHRQLVTGALTAGKASRRMPEPVAFDDPVSAALERLARTGEPALPVAAADGRLIGVVDSRTIDEATAEGRLAATAADLAEPVAPVASGTRLDDVLDQMLETRSEALPVGDDRNGISGWITYRDVLLAYARERGEDSPPRPRAAAREPQRSPS